MKTLNDETAKKFRERLYQRKVSNLLQHGTKGLNPLKKYKRDEKGLLVVSTKSISRFFFTEMGKNGTPYPDQYIESLYTLFRILSQEADPISFDCGFSIAEEDIQDAGNKKTIELLTTNLIITYFNNLKTHKGTVDTSLLKPDLKEVIARSSAGRDYKTLVSKTLTALIGSLADDKPWRDYLDDINNADLVCRLAGAKLPSMEKSALAGIIAKSRHEIKSLNDVFSKILMTREQMALQEKNKKKFLKAMEKMNEATLTVLKRINAYLEAAHRLMRILDLSPAVVLGKTDPVLMQNLTRLFFGAKSDRIDKLENVDLVANLGTAAARYRLSMLFKYPDITRYCCRFKSEKTYRRLYFDLFRLLYKDLAEKLSGLTRESTESELKLLGQQIVEMQRAVDNLRLAPLDLPEEKKAVRNAYVDLISRVDYTQLDTILANNAQICRVTQDTTLEIMAGIRETLVTSAFSSLTEYTRESLTADKAALGIKKRLHAYARHYKPQREFYRIFFTTYVGSKAQPMTAHLSKIVQTNKLFAAAMLMVLSDEKGMKDVLGPDQTAHARDLLIELRKSGAK
ncbi:MAG TPA: hypothetical protein DHV36_25560 [Desulfobacteraceae bacterium]|nr:hypothetical protein [Desulfobacteraceae bacterium]